MNENEIIKQKDTEIDILIRKNEALNVRTHLENGYPMPTHELKRPPQSWCYVEKEGVQE